jgi:hypothetical protein
VLEETRKIVIPIEPCLPALESSLSRLESELRTMGLGVQADKARAVRCAMLAAWPRGEFS